VEWLHLSPHGGVVGGVVVGLHLSPHEWGGVVVGGGVVYGVVGEHSWQLFEEVDEEWHFSPQVGE
jgi:hypothetical protein